MGAVFRWVKYIYEWCRDFALKGAGVGGGMPHGSFGGPIGNVWHVNGGADGVTAGADTNLGTKSSPFLTIRHALDQCINNHDDYIICWNTYNQDTFPIVPDVDGVHIIGVSGPTGNLATLDASAGDTEVFTLGGICEGIEIAGFQLAGGATHPAIQINSGSNSIWIHHNTFGHYWTGDAQDGISGGGSCFGSLIEDNWFYGKGGPNGTLSRYGIANLSGAWGEWTIRNNFFVALPTQAIYLAAPGTANHEFVIEHNIIGCPSDTDNIAIELGNVCHDCVVSDNKAQYGKVEMTNNPYGDAAADNHWMCNQVGSVMKYADEAM
ncbi:hypothetical protein ES703_119890 [subsurface metagenome]